MANPAAPAAAVADRAKGESMNTILMADPQRYPRMTTQELRDTFLLSGLSQPGAISLNYLDLDRAVVGMAVPPSPSPSLCPRRPNCARPTSLSAANWARSTSAVPVSST